MSEDEKPSSASILLTTTAISSNNNLKLNSNLTSKINLLTRRDSSTSCLSDSSMHSATDFMSSPVYFSINNESNDMFQFKSNKNNLSKKTSDL
jgi:hypothetical protein